MPRCYCLGFDSWVVGTETQGKHFKPTFRLEASPTNLESALSYWQFLLLGISIMKVCNKRLFFKYKRLDLV